ncbi:MAG: 2-(1,2-epoxy-1,2-dihydrophenyl)acetyl-CoA isomerase [Bacteroidetes bacterium]|nr:MAG: 2-(1,2-epoxy-1,2-dihydrophenyl)acetyl-CoA isomerase [Bacteroidota bacterium]REK05030.1 MAG: 2-(1,2-epoxy-1,2-dihydrophenyl)acetyl-CoA isomerase [Bacteroidota bacterium]REK36467.1 MAG: 2-(1,2-epoxy-1,2-dihydrophenyl)acetyl-CoA isomerase [Bacteroidota bacterium]REK51681.1 MAG: 2-(1,2-epoxy-1,2-dihydrophenyl)acetyl-CoA isomerase [Bacteroidota bacterium]
MQSTSILYSKENNIAIIRLNRPDKFNSFNREMALNMQEALKTAEHDEEIRAVFITGEGKAFCAGQDLSEAIDSDGPGIPRIVEEHYNPIIFALRNIPKPVVCAVNGVAAGAGANIALACDVVLAAKSASFIQAFSKIGLIPDSGGTFILPRLIGWQKASALMMTGDKVNAEEALNMGMIFKVFNDEDLQAEAMKICSGLAAMPTRGLGLTKKLLNNSFHSTLEQQLHLEKIIQEEAGNTDDYREGVNAFLEKRKPKFTGK